jgi:hypothetical protein
MSRYSVTFWIPMAIAVPKKIGATLSHGTAKVWE